MNAEPSFLAAADDSKDTLASSARYNFMARTITQLRILSRALAMLSISVTTHAKQS